MPTALFVSFAREDERFLNKLKKHLQPLQQQGLITLWHRQSIYAGSQRRYEIDRHLNSAHIILLLISPHFMASNSCYHLEMKQAMDRYEKGDAFVIPIILRPLYGWDKGPLGKLEALPTGGCPVTQRARWPTQDDAFANIAEGIHRIVDQRGSSYASFKNVPDTAKASITNDYSIDQPLPQPWHASSLTVVISSITDDLLVDRNALVIGLQRIPFLTVVWIERSNTSHATRILLAREREIIEKSDLFLVVTRQYPVQESKRNRQDLEEEFEIAYHTDPTKLFIFQRGVTSLPIGQSTRRTRQEPFYKGYPIIHYNDPHELSEQAVVCCTLWLKERASANQRRTLIDHFIHYAIQRKPLPTTEIFYAVYEDYIELRYKLSGKMCILHLEKGCIYQDFWGCLSHIDTSIMNIGGKERHGKSYYNQRPLHSGTSKHFTRYKSTVKRTEKSDVQSGE